MRCCLCLKTQYTLHASRIARHVPPCIALLHFPEHTHFVSSAMARRRHLRSALVHFRHTMHVCCPRAQRTIHVLCCVSRQSARLCLVRLVAACICIHHRLPSASCVSHHVPMCHASTFGLQCCVHFSIAAMFCLIHFDNLYKWCTRESETAEVAWVIWISA